MEKEFVLCVPREEFDAIGSFQGVSLETRKYLPLLTSKKLSLRERGEAETNTAFKQIIPYHLIMRDGEMLSYVRTKMSGEQRLATKRSIGIGGHINQHDIDGNLVIWKNGSDGPPLILPGREGGLYVTGEQRELMEELHIASPFVVNDIVGFINDDANDVGKVHLGVIHVINLSPMGGVGSDDQAIRLIGFKKPRDICLEQSQVPLEPWSQLILDYPDIRALLGGKQAIPHPFTDNAFN